MPCVLRWPGHIRAGDVSNEIVAGEDWFPTLLAAAGDPDVKERLLNGMKAGNSSYKVHLDGYNLLPYLSGKETESPRKEFYYFSDDGSPCDTPAGNSTSPSRSIMGSRCGPEDLPISAFR